MIYFFHDKCFFWTLNFEYKNCTQNLILLRTLNNRRVRDNAACQQICLEEPRCLYWAYYYKSEKLRGNCRIFGLEYKNMEYWTTGSRLCWYWNSMDWTKIFKQYNQLLFNQKTYFHLNNIFLNIERILICVYWKDFL